MFERTVSLMKSFLADGVPGCDILVCRNGQEIFRKQMGYSDREQKILMNGRERFNLYSCSKVITCTAALQLRDRGSFRLDDLLSDYLPEFRTMRVRQKDGTLLPARNPITIRNLFTMTAGFGYDTWSPSFRRCFQETQGRCPTREAIRCLAREALHFEPGSRWEYSLAHDVLGALIEVVSGMPFNDYLTEHIFRPLGMDRTTFLLPAADPDEVAPQYAVSHFQSGVIRIGNGISCHGFHCHPYRIGYEYASGGAGCVSTVEDYSRFLEALCKGDVILSEKTIREMSSGQLSEKQQATFWSKDVYDYGLGVRCPKQPEIPGHPDFGWGGAAGSYLAVDRTHKITFFYAQHVLNSPNAARRPELMRTILKDLQLL